jgi:hypothetical protein
MKQITNTTILKQGYKTYQPVEVDGVIYWVDEIDYTTEYVTNGKKVFKLSDFPEYSTEYIENYWQKIIAQSQPRLEGIPVVSLDSYVERLAKEKTRNLAYSGVTAERSAEIFIWTHGYNANPNHYTQKDIERAIELTKKQTWEDQRFDQEEIIEQINSISVIEVDEQFNILSYE